jgi:cbb3-type cytochrome oxidase subunit 3
MKQISTVWAITLAWTIMLSVLLIVAAFATYNRAEDRKAYYACLALSEKLAEQQKQPNGGIRIVSLPYCKI